MSETPGIIPYQSLEKRILVIRSQKVMLDAHLADLYGVETKALVRAVKRNAPRFPSDFMFRLTGSEFEALRFQFGTSSAWGGRRYLPYAFTEHGVAMLSSVLRSPQAVHVNIQIMRAFARLRQTLATHEDLARKLTAMEKKYDAQFKIVFDAIRALVAEPAKKKRPIGFAAKDAKGRYRT
jgi:hypothetical protein